MIVLIREPGLVASIQVGLQGMPNIYLQAPTRLSLVDTVTSVLDVRLPIVAPNMMVPGPYRVIEGHTRFYTAALRGVGIEAYLARTMEDLLAAPDECFATLPKEQCVEVYKQLDYYQKNAMGYDTVFIQDMM